MINNNFEDILNNRKSVKVFDDQFKIPREEMNEMIQKQRKPHHLLTCSLGVFSSGK